MTSPYRTIDREHRRSTLIAEACRIRDTLNAVPRYYNIANKRRTLVIGSSQEIIDVLTACIEELSAS